MLQMLALAAAMSFGPAQGGLELTNARITFGGEFGPTRPDNRYLPGDLFFMAFDIEGLHADAQGKVEYFMSMLVMHSSGKVLFENKPDAPQPMTLPLGATKLPARAYVLLGLDVKGACTCKVTVTDKATNMSRSIEKKFEVADPAFGIVCFRTSYDSEDTMPAPMMGVAGQALFLHFLTVGFMRDATTKQPTVQVELRVYDSAGRPTNGQPLPFVTKEGVKADVSGIDWHLPLPLNRVGDFVVELKADDKLSGKSYKITFPIKVLESVR
jgi:hypothetical protein